jgi:dUTP pyrophosphatase
MTDVVKFYKLYPSAVLPQRKTSGAAGFDLHAHLESTGSDKALEIYPGEFQMFGTGIGIVLPEGWEAQVRSRSGLASQGIAVLGGIGTIDCDYRGEIFVGLINFSKTKIEIPALSRIAQLVICKMPSFEIECFEGHPPDDTERGRKGFGSTGV